MPKNTKKKKDKASDFTKAKLKLGKGKQQPTNAIDTSFKARSIALPSQSIAADKDVAAPTTRRKLTLEDLLAHIKHYNAGTRRDAILGLRELLEGHPEMLEPSLTTLLNSCARLIGDEDASVRKTLLSFFKWLLSHIPVEILTPHSPALLLFTTSAQTHIFPEIRIDAVRFIDLFLDFIPDVVVTGWDGKGGIGRRILDGYLGILNAGTKFGEDGDTGPVRATSTASVALTTSSKLVILRSLAKFLGHALRPSRRTSSVEQESTLPTWYLASSFKTVDAYRVFDGLMRSPGSGTLHKSWKAEVGDDGDDDQLLMNDLTCWETDSSWTLQELSDFASSSVTYIDNMRTEYNGGERQNLSWDTRLAGALRPTLVSILLDCMPIVFSPTSAPPEAELGLVTAVFEICNTLYGAILARPQAGSSQNVASDDLRTILGYIVVHFPFQPSVLTKRDAKIEQNFHDLNLISCELTSILVLATASSPGKAAPIGRGKARQAGSTSGSSILLPVERVGEYVISLLKGEPSGPQSIGRAISAQGYAALVPTLWSLLNTQTPEQEDLPQRVLEAVLEHAIRISSTSAVKGITIEFLSRLFLLDSESQYTGSFRLSQSPGLTKAREWILHLPKTLWEIGPSNLHITEIVLIFLLRMFQRRSSTIDHEVAQSIRARLVPYFVVTHPSRGDIPGPFARLESASIRRLVLDLAGTVFAFTGPEESSDLAIQRAVDSTDEASYWIWAKATKVSIVPVS